MDKLDQTNASYETTLNEILKGFDVEMISADEVNTISERALSLSLEASEKAKQIFSPLQEAISAQEARNQDKLTKLNTARERKERTEQKLAELTEENASLQEELKKTSLELEQLNVESSNMLQETLKDIPLQNFTCSLLENITNIEWDIARCKDKSVVKGTILTKNDIKSFHFDLETQDLYTVREKLWDMMQEGEKFASEVKLVP